MSFILDALKKSEIDRQQRGGAEFAAIPLSPKVSSVPRWLWGVGFLLLLNLVVLIGLLLRPDSAPSPTPGPAPAIAEATPPSVEDIAAQPSFEQKVAAARQRPPEQQENGTTELVATNANQTVQAVLISQNPSLVAASDRYPSLQEVRASGSSGLPDLHLDIHVYSAEPEDRFVFINMTKLREGSQLDEGPVIAEITPDGVVLSHQGQYFLLRRD
ncbi:MAG: general secretion pathway protein GspB [Woeseiaceae bacterium]|nr:general secretion pathway protein GspB [Woeseiaceae bacterium]